MKLTLLEYVQDILSDLNSDDVTSIFDTVESEQVAQIVKSTYMSLMTNKNWPHQKKKIVLETSTVDSSPVVLKLPDNMKELILLNYDTSAISGRKLYKEIRWKENDDFLRKANQLNNEAANVDTIIDPSGVEYFVRNDIAPSYFTSFDDVHIVFDAYDTKVEASIDPDKVQAIAYVLPEWVHEDNFIPDLPAEVVVLLLEEAKARAAFRHKQTVDVKAEQEVRRQRQFLSRKGWRAHGGVRYPNYGRKSNRAGYGSPYFDKNNVKPT